MIYCLNGISLVINQVEVEALVIQGPRLATVVSQVKKLEVSVLVLGQKKPSPLVNWWVLSSNSIDLFTSNRPKTV